MPHIGDVIYDYNGNLLGVISKVLFDQFAVQVRGGAVVNYEDIDTSNRIVSGNLINPEGKTYIELYKIT